VPAVARGCAAVAAVGDRLLFEAAYPDSALSPSLNRSDVEKAIDEWAEFDDNATVSRAERAAGAHALDALEPRVRARVARGHGERERDVLGQLRLGQHAQQHGRRRDRDDADIVH
jgi:hypothetical protein